MERQLQVAPQLLNRDVILVLGQEVTHLHQKPRLIGARSDVGERYIDRSADFVRKVGIDDLAIFWLYQLDQLAQTAAHVFKDRQVDILPEFVGLNFQDQRHFSRHHGNVAQFLQLRGNAHDPRLVVDQSRIAAQHGQLCLQYQVVELLGGEIIVLVGAWKPRDVLRQLRAFVGAKLFPGIADLEFFNKAPFGANDEVVQGHAGHFVEQPIRDRLTETRERFISLLVFRDLAGQLDAGLE